MKRMQNSLVLAVAGILCFAGYAYSDEPGTEAKMELKQVSLFKNGLGFFVWEATIPDKSKAFYVVPPAAASHGTFWISYPPKVEVDSAVAKQVEGKELVDAVTMIDLLKANVGRRVRIYLSAYSKDDVFVEGKLIRLIEGPKIEPPNPYAPGRVEGADYRSGYYGVRNVAVLGELSTGEGQAAINLDSILRINFLNTPSETKYEKKTNQVRLDISLKKSAGGQKITVTCLAKGATWAPSYMIDITEPNKARLAAKAEVMDEVCDLEGADVKLVTGFPNLQFADTVSPIAMKENLAQFLQSLIRGQSQRGQALGVMSNAAVAGQSMLYDREERSAGELSVMPAYGAAEMGKTAEDLFLYPVENVRLVKGEVGYFPLFTESVPYKHIYRWEIPDYVNPEGDYYYDQQQRQQRKPEQQEVWHCLRLDNVMKMPWTTAPAEIIKDGVILGQDMLDYTPVKDRGTVKITRAVNIKAEQVELEKDRKRDVARWYNYNWDLVTVEGKLSVTNFQDKPITLEVTKLLSGEVKAMQPEAKLEKLAKALRAANANIKLTWTMELGAGEQKEVGYTYEVYVRR
jgi:hypothetical protein